MILSIISPAYNEEEVLPFFIDRVEKVCGILLAEGIVSDYEIIIINDGSTDNTWNIIKENHSRNEKIKGVMFSRNFGHHSTTIAGLDYARGDFVVFIDSDLQAQPEDIPRLLNEHIKGFDIVWGLARERDDRLLVKLSSRFFYWLNNRISGLKLPKETAIAGCSKVVVHHIRKMREVRQFAPALWTYVGFRAAFIEVDKKERFRGTVKYTFLKRVNLAIVGLTGFSKLPLKISTIFGFIMFFVSFLAGIYIVYRKIFYGIPIVGYASLFTSMMFFFGIQFLIFGILGEYIGIIFDEVKHRPVYIVAETLE